MIKAQLEKSSPCAKHVGVEIVDAQEDLVATMVVH